MRNDSSRYDELCPLNDVINCNVRNMKVAKSQFGNLQNHDNAKTEFSENDQNPDIMNPNLDNENDQSNYSSFSTFKSMIEDRHFDDTNEMNSQMEMRKDWKTPKPQKLPLPMLEKMSGFRVMRSTTHLTRNPDGPLTSTPKLTIGHRTLSPNRKSVCKDPESHDESVFHQTSTMYGMTKSLTSTDSESNENDTRDEESVASKAKGVQEEILKNIEKTEIEGKFEEINQLIRQSKKHMSKLKKSDIMEIGTGIKIPKSLQENIENLAGKEIKREEIINKEGFRLGKYIKMKNVEDYRKLRNLAEKKQQNLSSFITKLKRGASSIEEPSKIMNAEEVSREQWICAIHYAASMGIITIRKMYEKMKNEAQELDDAEERMMECINLADLRDKLIRLCELYQDVRAMSELAHLSSQLMYHVIPVPRNLAIYNVMTKEILEKMGHERKIMYYVHDMVKLRLMELGVRTIFARSHRLIIGFNERIAQLPISCRPILGKSRQTEKTKRSSGDQREDVGAGGEISSGRKTRGTKKRRKQK